MSKKIRTLFRAELRRSWRADQGVMGAGVFLFPVLLIAFAIALQVGVYDYYRLSYDQPLPHVGQQIVCGGFILAALLSISLVAYTSAREAFAREKDSGTLPLLLNSRLGGTAIVLTKLASVFFSTLLVTVTFHLVYAIYNAFHPGSIIFLPLNANEAVAMFAVILTSSLLLAVACSLICALSYNLTLAGALSAALFLSCGGVSIVSICQDYPLVTAFYAIPFMNTGSCIYNIFMQQATVQQVATTCISNLVYIAILAFVLCKLFYRSTAIMLKEPEEA